MKICYLTGKKIETKGDDAPQDNSKSLEHVIPNALGGKLKSRDILSHKANQDLNNLIDKEFVKIFEGFSLRLDLNRDRKTTPSMRGLHGDYDVEVVFKNDRYYPTKPLFDFRRKVIYADSRKTGENYRAHLLKKGEISEAEEVEIFDDMAGGIELKFSLDNKIFKQGFAKIAAGFASMKKVPRENLKMVIDIEAKKFREKIIVAPSIPTNVLEYEFELKVSKSAHYPIHGLVLSGSKAERFLYCHVDLFSTFQWYVLLDDDYGGEDVHFTYAQKIIDNAEIDFLEYFNSVLTKEGGDILAESYKRVSRAKFYEFQKSYGNSSLQKYTYFKFNSMSAFANYVFLKRKAESL